MKAKPITLWRRLTESDTWHFVPSCSNWPATRDSVTRKSKPRSGELCNECLAKQAAKVAAHVSKLPEKPPRQWWARAWAWFFIDPPEVPPA